MGKLSVEVPHLLDFDGIIAGDIAVTAAEGGTGYWAQIEEYKPSNWEGKNVPMCFGFYVMHEWQDEVEPYGWNGPALTLTPAVIRRGIELYLTGVPGNFEGRPFEDMEDLAAMDADEADCVVQLGFFGELVYG